MQKIIIIEPDEYSRAQVERVVFAAGFAQHCTVVARASENNVSDPCVFIALGPVHDDVGVLENDFFHKPLRVGALLDRIKKHTAHASDAMVPELLSIGPHVLNTVSRSLKRGDSEDEINLTEKENHILLFLNQHAPDTVDRDVLLQEVWGYAQNVETHTLETHMYRLRQKIEQDPAAPQILVTCEKGYKIIL